MAEVFVSYAQEDRDVARALMEAIESAGLDIVRADATDVGDAVARAAREGDLQAARCLIYLWSKAAAQSRSVQDDVQRAIQAWSEGLLVLATLDDTALPVGLRDLQGIPVSGPAGIDAARLLDKIRSMVQPRERPFADVVADSTEPSLAPSPPQRPHRRRMTPLVAGLVATSVVLVAGLIGFLWLGAGLRTQSPGVANLKTPMPQATVRPRYEVVVPPPAPPLPKAPAVALPEPPPAGGLSGAPKPPPALAPRPRPAEPGAPPAQSAEVRPPAFRPPSAPPPPVGSKPGQGPPQVSQEHAKPRPPPRSTMPPAAPAPGPSNGLLIILAVLVSGVGIGAGAVWAWSTMSRARTDRLRTPPSHMLRPAPLPADPAHQVFVSYSRQDESAVDDLVREIEQAGYAVWIDRHSTGSQRYAAPIVRAIKSSRLVALMCSQNAFTSDHVIREVYVAGDYKKPFIAFQLDRSEFPDEVLYFVSGFPRVPIEALDVQQLRSELARLVVV